MSINTSDDLYRFSAISYVCECGYTTINKSNANKHAKTHKCSDKKISKSKMRFRVNDENVMSLVTDTGSPCIDSCTSWETCISSLSIVSEGNSASEINSVSNRDVSPGLIHYIYDKTHDKRASLDTSCISSKDDLYEHYTNVHRDPEVISIFTPDITNVTPFIKDIMRKNNIMDREHVIHGPETIKLFVDCVSDYNISLYNH